MTKFLTILLGSMFAAGIALAGVSAVDPPAAEAAGGYVGKCGGGRILLNADERQSFILHNQQRNRHNLRPFCVDPSLQRVARAHSRDMVQRNYFSHTTKGTNRDACDRIKNAGYRYRYCAENIGYNSTPNSMFNAWMNSSGHRTNILSGKYREIGIGAVDKGAGNTMYTVDFGTRL